ncbi:trehalose-phosphate synthase (UDP-forming) isoform 1 [Cyclospora cayetanensis]|uniref:Trehalose-phosphate synthase (UDP-forming) isoform 1 n=1 Tax=Cyclospora cayetanensis TaxID=88456 RepID=A0A1D3CY23_9EIME|nr:trehalose-phosphate synthase (UDP-forming) isoform 1 [Cyclospora cayetanensis]
MADGWLRERLKGSQEPFDVYLQKEATGGVACKGPGGLGVETAGAGALSLVSGISAVSENATAANAACAARQTGLSGGLQFASSEVAESEGRSSTFGSKHPSLSLEERPEWRQLTDEQCRSSSTGSSASVCGSVESGGSEGSEGESKIHGASENGAVGSSGSCGSGSIGRLIIVANRLPLSVELQGDGSFKYTKSGGGLVSGLQGIKGLDCLWVGWPGSEAPPVLRPRLIAEYRRHGCAPVFLDQQTIDAYYNGFCNNVLWPLLHYLPPPLDLDSGEEQSLLQWRAYVHANELFCETVCEVMRPGDMVWVHDYHLMLLPKLLRGRCREDEAELRIGWFLHTPFPSSELFRLLPYRAELLTGLLSANLLGFHVDSYMRHFFSACVQTLGLEVTDRGVLAAPVGGVYARCAAIPIGIDSDNFIAQASSPQVQKAAAELRREMGNRQVVLGVDRLDYMKGLPHKLNAFDSFLQQHPEMRDSVLLLQVAVPTRTGVHEYQKLKTKVHELVGRINGSRGSLSRVPLQSLDRSVSPVDLCALYLVADCLLITSLRDGMNLVALEFVASQQAKACVAEEQAEQFELMQRMPGGLSLELPEEPPLLYELEEAEGLPNDPDTPLLAFKGEAIRYKPFSHLNRRLSLLQRRQSKDEIIMNRGPGVLILSEFAGAAEFLQDGSLIINPWNEQQSAQALYSALTMPRAEREERHRKLIQVVISNTSTVWAQKFITALKEASDESEGVRASVPPLLQPTSLLPAFLRCRRPRLVVVSIWGGLLPVRSRTSLPLPERTPDPLPPSVAAALTALAGLPQTAVVVLTEHPRTAVEQLFADIPVCVAVEKGAKYRTRGGEWITLLEESTLQGLDDWMPSTRTVMDYYQLRVVEKEFGSAFLRSVGFYLCVGSFAWREEDLYELFDDEVDTLSDSADLQDTLPARVEPGVSASFSGAPEEGEVDTEEEDARQTRKEGNIAGLTQTNSRLLQLAPEGAALAAPAVTPLKNNSGQVDLNPSRKCMQSFDLRGPRLHAFPL